MKVMFITPGTSQIPVRKLNLEEVTIYRAEYAPPAERFAAAAFGFDAICVPALWWAHTFRFMPQRWAEFRADRPALIAISKHQRDSSEFVSDCRQTMRLSADDCLPFWIDGMEFAARVNAIRARTGGFDRNHDGVATVRGLTITEDQTAWYNGRRVSTSKTEAKILYFLMTRLNTVVTKDRLMGALYEQRPEEPDMKILDVFMCKLRRALVRGGMPKPDVLATLRTVWGRGFMATDMEPEDAAAEPDIGNNLTRTYHGDLAYV